MSNPQACDRCKDTGLFQVKVKRITNGREVFEILDVPCGCPLGNTKAANKHWKKRLGSRHDQERRLKKFLREKGKR